MEPTKEHFRHILLYYFHKGKNASQVAKKMSAVYGKKALKETECQSCFVKFRSEDFQDKPHSGRPSEVHDDDIKALIESDHRVTEREISQSTVHDHI